MHNPSLPLVTSVIDQTGEEVMKVAVHKARSCPITDSHRSFSASPLTPLGNPPCHPDLASSLTDFANKTNFPISVPIRKQAPSGKCTHMIYTARNDHYQIFQFNRPIFYLARTLECLSYSVEEYIGWTSVQCHSG